MRRSLKNFVESGVQGKTQPVRAPGLKTALPHSAATLSGAFFQLQNVAGNQAVQHWCESDPPERFPGLIGKSGRFDGREVTKATNANPIVHGTRVQRQPVTAIDEQAQKQAAKKIRDAFTFADGYVSPKFTPSNAKLVGKAKEMLASGGELAKEMAQGRDVTYERELVTGGTKSFTEKKSVTVSGDVEKFPVLVTWELYSILETLKANAPDAALLALIGVLEEFWIDHTGHLGTTWVPDVIEINAVLPAKGFTKITSVDLIPRSIVFVDQHALIEPGPYRDLSEGEKEKRTVDIVAAHELIHALGYTDAWIHPFLKQFGLAPKLERDVAGVRDEWEQEADRVAIAIMDPVNKEKFIVHPLAEGAVPGTMETTKHPQQPFPAGSRHSRPGLIQRAPFPGETPELEQRRKEAIAAAQNAAQTLEKRLRSGSLWPLETVQGPKVIFYPDIIGQSLAETKKERNARLLKLVDDLWKLATELQGGPIPSAWLAPDIVFPGGGRHHSDMDIEMFYGHRMQERYGMDHNEVWRNCFYIGNDPDPTRSVSFRPRDVPPSGEMQLGIWLVVKDPVNRPQEWKRLSGYEPMDGEIVELSSDRRGYFYYWYGEKKYLPDYPD